MFDAFTVAVQIALKNEASPGLIAFGIQLQQTNKHANEFEKSLVRIHQQMKLAGAVGSVGKSAFSWITSGMKEATDAAATYERQLARLTAFGLTPQQQQSAVNFVRNDPQMTAIKGFNVGQKMGAFNEAQGIFRESGADGEDALKAAKTAAPYMLAVERATAGLSEEAGDKMRHAMRDGLRFAEDMGGLKDENLLKSLLNSAFKGVMGSSGNISFSDLRQVLAQGKTATIGINADVLNSELEPIVGIMGGSKFGTGLNTAYGRAAGTVKGLDKTAVQAFLKYHLWDPKKVVLNDKGGVDHFTGNPLVDDDLFHKAPNQWYFKDVRPVYDDLHLSASDRYRMNQVLFQKTGGGVFNEIDRLQETSRRSKEAYDKALGVSDAMALVDQTPSGKFSAARAAKEDVQIAAGEAGMPAVTKGAEAVTTMLQHVAQFSTDHPDGTAWTIGGAAAGAGGLWAGGKLFKGLLNWKMWRLASLGAGVAEGGGALAAGGAVAEGGALVAGGATAASLAVPALIAAAVGGLGYGGYKLYKHFHPDDSAAGGPMTFNVVVNLDSKPIAKIVYELIGKELQRRDSASSGFDPGATQPQVAGGWKQ